MNRLILVFAVAPSLVVWCGCSRQASPSSSDPKPEKEISALVGKSPKFECELIQTHDFNGKTGSSSHFSTKTVDNKLFTSVENYTTTVNLGSVNLKYEFEFLAHRDGKDVYKLTYTISDTSKSGVGSETKTSEFTYEGQKKVVIQDKYGSAVFQPPNKK